MRRSTSLRHTLLALLLAFWPATSFAVSTSQWVQTSETDFKDGTFENVVATNLGDLKLSRAVQTLLEQDPKVSSVNALAEGPDGTIYAGTSPHGILLRVKGDAVDTALTLESDPNILSLAFDKAGHLLIGTGGELGRVLRVDNPAKLDGDKTAKDAVKELFKADEVQYVWAMRQTPDGFLYLATGPTGKLFEVKGDGTQRILFDAKDNNILSLASDGKDLLYAGTDPNGLIYRVNRKTGESFVLFDAPESEISALVLDSKGNLFAGTAESHDDQGIPGFPGLALPGAEPGGRPESAKPGTPLPSEPPDAPEPPKLPDPTPGQPKPIPKVNLIHKASSRHVRLVAAFDDPDDDKPDQPAPTQPPAAAPAPPAPPTPPGGAPPAPTPMPPASDPSSLANRPPVNPGAAGQPRAEGNAVYKIDPEGFVTEVFRQPVLVLAMVERNGTLLIATGSGTEGHIYEVNPAADETIVLAKVNPKQVLSLLPAKDGRVYLGLANVGSIAAMSSGFATAGTYTSSVLDASQISRFGKIQLRGLLPEGSSLKLSTRSGNVKDPTSESWSKWSDDQPATEFVQVGAPSARFLQYRLSFTSNAGKGTPVVEDVTIAYQMPNLPPQVKSIRATPVADAGAAAFPGLAASAGGDAEPVKIPSARKQTIAWEASDPNGDALSYSLFFRRGADAPWILLKEKIRENQFEWDTRSVADGRYEVKVVATDASANPPGNGKTTSRVSDAIIVDNTPPVIGNIKWMQAGTKVAIDMKIVDRSSTVAALDYAVDSNKDWQAVLPVDNIFDSPEEAVSIALTTLAPGPHQVTLRATDSKGNPAFENVMVTVEAAAAKR